MSKGTQTKLINPSDKFVVGVIGCGRIGKIHVQNLVQSIPGIVIKTVADPKLDDSLRSWLKSLNIANITTDAQQIINDPEINVVIICSSTDTHAKYSIAAAKSKKAIFCEKPIDSDLGRIKEVLAAVKENNVKFMVGFNRRFDHNFKRIRDATVKGDLGKVQIVKVTSRDPSPPPLEYVKVSGGLFFDMSIHDWDMARFQAGDEVEEVYALGDVQISPEIKGIDIDTAVAVLKYKNGAMGLVDNCRQAVYGYDQRVEVFGTKGCAIAENDVPTTVKIYTKDTTIQDKIPYFFLERYMGSYQEEMKQFFDCLKTGKEMPVTGQDGMMDIVVAIAATKSLKEHRPVKISEVF
jgi:myo-inositol 2-dehydrogenase/D-chiro-inositol 1-dehydrogenase